jgi:hypothetical protein
MNTTVVGVDCATNPQKIGLARGEWSRGQIAKVTEVVIGARSNPAEIIRDWTQLHAQTLLAIDAPLGWPAQLGESLARHWAGNGLDEPADKLFRRETDRFIKQLVGMQTCWML